MKNRLSAVTLTTVAALALSGCAGGSAGAAADPAGVLAAYLTALDEGEYGAALEMVASSGEITADAIVTLEDPEFAEPEQLGADLASDVTSGSIEFAIGAHEGFVEFSRVDGAWKLDTPLFLSPVLSDNDLSALDFLKPEVTLPDGAPLDADQYIVVNGEATYAFPAEYSGGTRYDPISFDYLVTYSPSDDGLGQVEVAGEPGAEIYDPSFSDAYSDEVIEALPDTVVDEATLVAGDGIDRDASYQITVDTIAEPHLNDCEWSGGNKVSNPATIACTPTQYTLTFTTDWPALADRYPAGAIGATAHPAGARFTYTQEMPEGMLYLRLIDETIPGEVGDPRPSAYEFGGDPLDRPAP